MKLYVLCSPLAAYPKASNHTEGENTRGVFSLSYPTSASDTLSLHIQSLKKPRRGSLPRREREEYAGVPAFWIGWRIDLSGVDAVRTFLVEDHFYVALRERRVPTHCTGGSLFVHAVRDDHTIYRIERDGSPIVTLKL